ncbi:MAG: beta-ketoacyl synthase chain length factor [Gammaproteobacteria bacterium]
MVTFQIESWAAIAPGLETREAWQNWLKHPEAVPATLGKMPLKEVPPMLRRRFGTLGKCAMAAALQVLNEDESIPGIFSSRHGDTALTLSLLEEMGRDEPMSPTGFSLAVHNAVSGLFSIVRKDTSMVTSLAAMEGLVLHTLLEAVGQLQVSDRVLCVIYDIPLPDLYRHYCTGDDFPYAIAVILGNADGESYSIEPCEQVIPGKNSPFQGSLPMNLEPIRFLELLAGISTEMGVELNGAAWRIAKTET